MVFFIQQQNRNMNWVWITQQLEELDLLAFTQTCFALCEKWFGVCLTIMALIVVGGLGFFVWEV